MYRHLFEYHPTIGYRFIPNTKTRIQHESGGYLIRTNNWGFRSEIDFSEAKLDAGLQRILLFGDSFTAGDGVSNRKRYGDVLQTMLPGYEVYNFGLPGTGTDQQYLAFREFASHTEYDLVIIAVLVENIRRVNAQFRLYFDENGQKVIYQKPFFTLENGRLVLNNTPVDKEHMPFDKLPANKKSRVDKGGRLQVLREWAVRHGLKEFIQKTLRYQPLPEYSSPHNPEWILMRSILEKWIGALDVSKVLIMPIPLYQYIEGTSDASRIQKRFAELGKDTGVRIADPLPWLKSFSAQEKRNFRFAHDIHLTELGHKAIADFLFSTLQEVVHGNKT